MPYQIHDIRTTHPDAFPFYFLDANALIYHLSPRATLYGLQRHYASFIDAVVNLHTTSNPVKPRFVWLSLSISEVINAWLRKDFHQATGMVDFKRDYRPSSRCLTTLSLLKSDLLGYEPFIEVMDDAFTSMGCFTSLLPSLTSTIDFNDLYFAEFMRKKGIAIVTHDGDFNFENVPIITCHTSLLAL